MAWLTGWQRRRKITVTNETAETFTNFQIRIIVTPDVIDYNRVQADADDIVFTESDGTTALIFERIETNIGGDTEFAVRILSLAASSDTEIFMYYGNPSATNSSSLAVTWPNYTQVNHFRNISAGVILTTKGNPVSTFGSPIAADNGIDFGGASDNKGGSWADINLIATSIVFEAGVTLDFIGDGPIILSEIEGGNFDGFGRLGLWTQTAFGGILNFTVPRAGGFCCINIGAAATQASTPFADGQRHHIVGRHEFFTGITDLFLDGVKVATSAGATGSYNTGAPSLRVATSWKDGAPQVGQKGAGNIQYARLRNTDTAPASDNRILMDYKSWYTNDLVTFGPPESEAGGVLERSQVVIL